MSTTAIPPHLDSSIPPPYPVRRWTVAEYRRLAESGALTTEDRVELLEGWIVPKMTHNPPHDSTIQKLMRRLVRVISDAWELRVQSAIDTPDSEPEPDLAIVAGPEDRFAAHHPTSGEIELIIEVANTTLGQDRRKRRIYALAEVPVYWIVNLVDRQIEVYSVPDAATRQYRDSQILKSGDACPLVIGGNHVCDLAVDDILPRID